MARFSPAFLILKAHEIGVEAAFVPMILIVMYLVFSLTAYPFGILADRISRRLQLGVGAIILIGADMVLAAANAVRWMASAPHSWGFGTGRYLGTARGDALLMLRLIRSRGTAFGSDHHLDALALWCCESAGACLDVSVAWYWALLSVICIAAVAGSFLLLLLLNALDRRRLGGWGC